MMKRLIVLLLCICMVGSMTVYAMGSVQEPVTTETNGATEASKVNVPEVEQLSVGVEAPMLTELSDGGSTSVAGLEFDKKVTPNTDGSYTVRLDAYTTGSILHTTTGNKVDIILVLDMSAQMATANRLAEMKKAAVSFIESSITTDGSRRIALVTYNNTAWVKSGSLTDNDAALVKVTPEAAENMCQTVNALTGPTGASNIDQGMMKAAHIFQDGNSKVPVDRQRIVVLLSAGVFGSGNLMEVEGKDHNGRTQIRQSNIEDLRVGERGLLLGSIIKTPRDQTAPIQNSQAYFDGEVTKQAFTTFFGSNFTGCGAELYCIGVGMPKAVLGSATYGDFKANYNDLDKKNSDGTWRHPENFWKNYGVLGTMINEVMYRMSSHRPDSSHVGGDQYNSWEQDWKTLMQQNGYTEWPTQHGFWEGHYWDNYTRNMHESFPDRCDISYFITTDDASDLSSIFDTINQNLGEVTTSLPSTTVMKDIVTPYFDMPVIPEGGVVADVVKAYTMDYNGTSFVESTKTDITSTVTLGMDRENRTVTVSGYEFDKNYITDEGRGADNAFFGKKLIIEFNITVIDGFLGGDGVLTNDGESGIYTAEGEALAIFPHPNADIKVKEITPEFNDGVIYASQSAELPHIANVGHFKVGSTSYTIDGINNAYADIKYTISLDENNYMTATIPAGTKLEDVHLDWLEEGSVKETEVLLNDTQYEVKCEVISHTNEANNSEVTGTPTIHVYKPEITFKDSVIKLGETANYAEDNFVEIVWKHNGTEADTDVMGPAPTLEFDYKPEEDDFTKETNVSVTSVTAKATVQGRISHNVPADLDIFAHTTFYREACAINNCPHTARAVVEKTAQKDQVNFVVHLANFDLKLTKNVVNTTGGSDANQKFLFRITGPDSFSMDVTLVAGQTVTIKALPAGEYTITELTDWSWRYDGEEAKKVSSAEVDANGVVIADFTNTRQRIYWLSGEYFIRNLFNQVITTQPIDPSSPVGPIN